jgi:hypothetical protein
MPGGRSGRPAPVLDEGQHEMFMIFKRSGEPAQFRFMPGCLVFSIVASIVLTILLNLLIRLF